MKIYVIIVTYKGKQWYNKCFGSLRESTIPLQIVAVDNTPGDEDADYIKTHFPEVHLIKTNDNLGFGRANNIGMRYAMDNGCDYVFLLNQDTWLEQKDAIEKLLKIAEANPEYGIISPMHLSADMKKVDMNIEYDNHSCSYALVSDLYCHTEKDIYSTDYVNAAAWLLPRKTLEVVGGFDPIFIHYEEDDNYLHRVIYHKMRVGLCPSAFIIHDHQDHPLTEHQKEIRRKQLLLIHWTNINKPFSALKIVRYYVRKYLSNVMSFNTKEARKFRWELSYCISMRKRILCSRHENMRSRASWL